MSYTNADGLFILTNEAQGADNETGKTTVGLTKFLTVKFEDLTELTDTTWSPQANDAFIPAGAVITRAWSIVDTAATSGGSAVLDIGLFQADGTVIDDDGIDAAIAVASLTADAVTEANGADVGTKVGSASAYVGATYDTAAFTAGAVTVVVEYIEL